MNTSRIFSKTLFKSIINLKKKLIDLKTSNYRSVYGRTWQKKLKPWKLQALTKYPEIGKTKKADNGFLRLCTAGNTQNTTNKWAIGCILSFSKKVKLGIIKNYTGITLNANAPKFLNAVLLKHIQLENKHILRKNRLGFPEIDPTLQRFWLSVKSSKD